MVVALFEYLFLIRHRILDIPFSSDSLELSCCSCLLAVFFLFLILSYCKVCESDIYHWSIYEVSIIKWKLLSKRMWLSFGTIMAYRTVTQDNCPHDAKAILLMILIHVSVIVIASFVTEPVKTSQILHIIWFTTVFAFYSVLHTLLTFHIAYSSTTIWLSFLSTIFRVSLVSIENKTLEEKNLMIYD